MCPRPSNVESLAASAPFNVVSVSLASDPVQTSWDRREFGVGPRPKKLGPSTPKWKSKLSTLKGAEAARLSTLEGAEAARTQRPAAGSLQTTLGGDGSISEGMIA